MKPVTLTPPNASLFAGVQVDVPDPDGRDGRRIVGAAPAFRMENRLTGRRIEHEGGVAEDETVPVMVPLERVRVDCDLEPGDSELRAVWAYEDSTIPNETVETSPRRRLGGSR